jgi:hypothetical protein
MNRYVVAYISFYDNFLHQCIVESTSKRQAMLDYLAQCQDITFDEADLMSMEDADEVMEMCFNMDSCISVIRIL